LILHGFLNSLQRLKMQLAIDTSTEIASLAILQDEDIISEMTWHCGLNHSVEMFPRLDYLIRKSGLDIRSTDCVFVALGPGSFNGLRVGVSAAKGLAYSLGARVIGIGTLEIAAYPYSQMEWQVCALQNAGRQEIAAALFKRKARRWQEVAPAHLTTVEALAQEIKEKTLFCGEFDAGTASGIKKVFKTQAILASPALRLRRAANLAELGRGRLIKEDYDDPATLQPCYLRRPPITERKKN
jgi:tRNA threonylcarbamoyl adenosine modification protein YeaZ